MMITNGRLIRRTIRRACVTALCAAFLVQPVAASASCAWTRMPSGDNGINYNILNAVSATSATNAWGVGEYYYHGDKTLIEHWDGATWTIVPGANERLHWHYRLEGTAAIQPSDVWAVGYVDAGGFFQPLSEHWNGTTWSIVRAPFTNWTELLAVAAVSTSDVWAVGIAYAGVNQTLIENWNGSSWSIVPSPDVNSNNNQLSGIAALPSGEAWAVGSYDEPGTQTAQTLIEHWNGVQWTIVPSPNASQLSNELVRVAAVGPRDAWTVGAFNDGTRTKTLVEHWNGLHWKIVHSESPGITYNILSSVSATSATDVWAVGSRWKGNSDKTLVEHWDGTSWSVIKSPSVFGSNYNDLWGVAAISPTSALAVGDYQGVHDFRTLGLLFHC